MNVIGIIPARYASTRLPGKPLAHIGKMTMIERTYRRVHEVLENVWVATDDARIIREVEAFGGNAVITSQAPLSGTERCAEALLHIGTEAQYVVNIQGDEPFIEPADITALIDAVQSQETPAIATLVRKFNPSDGFEALFSPHTPKVVMDSEMNAIYFSRSIIPYVRNAPWQEWLSQTVFHTHVGTYAFDTDTLLKITKLPPSPLEEAESLEQLRWIYAGYRIKAVLAKGQSTGIDTPEDLLRAQKSVQETDL